MFSSIRTATAFALIGLAVATTAAATPEVPIAVPNAAITETAAAEYWTPERMKRARAVEMGQAALSPEAAEQIGRRAAADGIDNLAPEMRGGRGLDFTSSKITPTTANNTAPYRMVGKLFFTQPGIGDFVCSGAVIKQRLVVTAGHCVHPGNGSAASYYQNFTFVPGYDGGGERWYWGSALVSGVWYAGGGTVPNAEDWAVIQMNDNAGVRIGTKVGMFDYMTYRTRDNHLTMLGYPAAFDAGRIMHHCSSSDWADNGSNTTIYGCDMTGGSSGGPWVQNFGAYSIGEVPGIMGEPNRIVGVTSYAPLDTSQRYLGASIFNDNFNNMITRMCSFGVGHC
jgi:V8-like Glu-specific endopeptidase